MDDRNFKVSETPGWISFNLNRWRAVAGIIKSEGVLFCMFIWKDIKQQSP